MTLPDRVSTDVALQIATAWRDADRDALRAEIERLREALEQAGRRLQQIQRDRTERDKVYAYSTNGLSEIALALDEDLAKGNDDG